MKKLLVLIVLITLCGCTKDVVKRVDLSDKYYNEGKYVEVKSSELPTNETYLLFTYNSYCNMEIPCDTIFQKFMDEYKIDILSMTFEEFKNTSIYNTVKYAPSIILVDNNKVIAYLDANKDEDLKNYQDAKEFTKWINKYVNLKEK